MLFLLLFLAVAPPTPDPLADSLRRVGESITVADPTSDYAAQLREQLRAAGQRENAAWSKIEGKAAWETFRDERLGKLRLAMRASEKPPLPKAVRVQGTLLAQGEPSVVIERVSFASRPDLLVTANLYRPKDSLKSMPGIVLCHSHHNPKTEGELQDMGVMWAKAGCVVLVPDMLGHGERRQHPFRSAESFQEPFRVGRQDYFFRYNVAVHLECCGESLMGWFVHDLRCCVSLLLARPGVDPERIGLFGAVAGGGDPVAVTGTLDRRITVVAPFNFGGPQPETRYPLLDDAETSFNYTGGGGWESTRNLARSARDGFLPWVIVGSIAPRGHIYGHEFSWDEKRDPVWRRLKKIHAFYSSSPRLAAANGTGILSGRAPEASHCNNIGPVQRKGIHQALQAWWKLPIPDPEPRSRRATNELLCLDKERPLLVHELLAKRPTQEPTADLRATWKQLLGSNAEPLSLSLQEESARDLLKGVRLRIRSAQGSTVRVLSLLPASKLDKQPLIVCVAQGGAKQLLRHRSGWIADRLREGQQVALVTLGGQWALPSSGGRTSSTTSLASSLLMLGKTDLGERLAELRGVLAELRKDPKVDPKRITLRGESLAAPNTEESIAPPLDVRQPQLGEPGPALLVLLTGLFEEVATIEAKGALVSWRSLLETPFVHVPYTTIIPGAVPAGDVVGIVAAQKGRAIRLEAMIDGCNRAVDGRKIFAEVMKNNPRVRFESVWEARIKE
jgi:dienelactone hydrolase